MFTAPIVSRPIVNLLLMKIAWLLLGLIAGAVRAQSIETIAGTGTAGFSGDGGPGVKAQINNPYGLVTGPGGALYFCEIGNHRIRRLDLKTHVISTVAGSGKKGYSGDGGSALEAALNEPYEIRFDRAGNMFFVEMQNHVVRRVDAKTHLITTVAGTGTPGFSGDGGPAVKAQFRQPHSIVFDRQGRLLVCDIGNHRIRRVDLKRGTVETWAGTGKRDKIVDGTKASEAALNGPRAIAIARNGDLYLALREGNAVYRIDGRSEKMYRFAGTGETGLAGDGGPALDARLAGPKGVALSPRDEALYLADTENHAIRRIDLKTQIITTVGGTGKRGDGPEPDPLKCALARPHGVFVAPDGAIYIGDSEAHRVRLLMSR